jgi:hypothetical protein
MARKAVGLLQQEPPLLRLEVQDLLVAVVEAKASSTQRVLLRQHDVECAIPSM